MMLKGGYLSAILVVLVFILSACTSPPQPVQQEVFPPVADNVSFPPPPEPPQEKLADKIVEALKPEPKLPEVNLYEDLVITDRTHVINRSKLLLHGNLVVNGTGKLVVVDSELHFVQDFNMQHRAYFYGDSVLEMENVKLSTQGKWFNFQYNGNVKAAFRNVHGDDCCLPWHSSLDNASFDIRDSTAGITVSNNVNVMAENSSLFFELVLTDSKGRFSLPRGYKDKLNLDIPNENGVIRLRANGSNFRQWGLTLDHHTDATFIDSYLTIGMNVGSDWRQSPSTVTFRGLKAKVYDDFSFGWDSNYLHLLNSEVTSWYPQAWNGATLIIEESDLADLQNNGQDSTVIVRNSKVALAIARFNVVQKYHNSTIEQDVIVHDDAQIFLYNTKVGGRMIENGNGRIFMDGKRLGS